MKMCIKKQFIYFICTFMCVFYRSLFVLFLLSIVLSVLRYTDSDYPFDLKSRYFKIIMLVFFLLKLLRFYF
jgi:hypothetical protein